MRYTRSCALALSLMACGGGPTSPSLHTQVFTDTLSSVDHPMYSDFKTYSVDVSSPGVLTAAIQWVGEGGYFLWIYSTPPPFNGDPLTSNQISHAVPLTASVTPGTYYVMVSQQQIPAGPARGACGCVTTFTLTVTYP